MTRLLTTDYAVIDAELARPRNRVERMILERALRDRDALEKDRKRRTKEPKR